MKSKVSAPERVKNFAGELSILDTVRVLNKADLFLALHYHPFSRRFRCRSHRFLWSNRLDTDIS